MLRSLFPHLARLRDDAMGHAGAAVDRIAVRPADRDDKPQA